MIRSFVRPVFPWATFAFVSLSSFELLLFGRFDPTRSFPIVIGVGVGLAVADRNGPIRRP